MRTNNSTCNWLFTVLVLTSIVTGCKKSSDNGYTDRLGRMRTFHRHHHVRLYPTVGTYHDTNYTQPDTTFAPTVVNSKTISVPGYLFEFSEHDATRHIYYFGTAGLAAQGTNGEGFAYYYEQDSLLYLYNLVADTVTHDITYYE